jgi:hypothetical protein
MSDFEHEKYIKISVPADLSLDKGWELEALLRTVEEAMTEARTQRDGSTYQIVVELPADLDRAHLDELLDAVANAVHGFEQRWPDRTWDVHIAGGVLSESHSAEAAFRRVCDENERLHRLLHKLYPVTMWSQTSLTQAERELFTRAYSWVEREGGQ